MENNLKKLINEPYKYGFSTNIETENFPYGISEDIVRLLSKKKNEPDFLLKFRLKSYKQWKNLIEPEWSILNINKIDYQNIVYYSVPKKKKKLKSLDEIDPNIKTTFDKRVGPPGISPKSQAFAAITT